MNNASSKILKFISKTIGFFLINFAVVFVLLAFFINSSVNDIDSLKNDLQTSIQEEIVSQGGDELKQIQEYCKINPQDERCNELQNISSFPEFNQLFENIKLAKNYINFLLFASFILFLFGFIFVYFAEFNLLETFYRVSVHLTISNFLAALYFNFLPNVFNIALNSPQIKQITQEIPPEYINKISDIMLNWLQKPLFVTLKLTIILGAIFLVISIVLYFVKKKALKDKNKAK